MKPITQQELEKGQVVTVLATTGQSKGFIGGLFRVLAVDDNYAVFLWLIHRTRYTVDLREFAFAVPSDEFIAAALPDEQWDEFIEEAAEWTPNRPFEL